MNTTVTRLSNLQHQTSSMNLQPGSAYPIGATISPGGVNFSVYANKTQVVELL